MMISLWAIHHSSLKDRGNMFIHFLNMGFHHHPGFFWVISWGKKKPGDLMMSLLSWWEKISWPPPGFVVSQCKIWRTVYLFIYIHNMTHRQIYMIYIYFILNYTTCITLHYHTSTIPLHYTTYITLHYIPFAWHCIALHFIKSHCITLHCITFF